MDDPFPDWQCLTCGLVSHGSYYGGNDEELARPDCRFCQTPRPDLNGWIRDPEGFLYHPGFPPASLEVRDWRRAHPFQPDPT